MSVSGETLGAAKRYVRESLLGGGAVVGKNVTVSSITPIDGGNRVTFSYTLDNGTVKTSTMDVMDGKDGIDGTNGKNGKDGQPGKDGSDGIGISKIEKIGTVDLVDTYRITFTDNSTFDYEVTNGKDGQGGGTADVPIEKIKVNGELQTPVNKVVDITVPSIEGLTKDVDLSTVAKSGSYEDLINKPTIPDITGLATETYVDNKVADYTKTVDLADVATTGSYNDLADKPTIPEAYDDTALSNRVTDVEDSIGDMSLIQVASVSDLVSAINSLYNAFMSGITYANKKLTITYRNGGSVDIDMSAIITDTKLTELSDVDDTGITDKQVLSYDSATSKYIPTTIDTAGVLADAKKYTDDEIKKINNADAIAVDEKPTYSDGTITYKKDGVESTITDGDYWFFYTVQNMAYQTIWIDGVEFTTSVDGSVDFNDFVSKTNDLTSTYTGEETDKTKVTTIASLDALYAIISTALGKKVNTSDIVDSLVSDATDKPLSAAQGKALDGKKVDKVDGMALSSNDYTDEEKSLVATIEDKVDKTSVATALDDTVTDEQVASALLAKTELGKKLDKTSIVTELSEASTDDEVVGALTTYNELQKLESATKEQFATASGDYITVNDSVDGKIIELGVKGNSFQQTYSGKNLFDCATMFPTSGQVSGITLTNNGDGTFTLSGTATANAQIFKDFTHEQTVAFFKNGAGIYTLSTQELPTTGNVFQCTLVKYNGTDSDYTWRSSPQGKAKSYNITQEMLDNELFFITFMFYIGSGSTINQTFTPQVEFGSSATEYEPYVGGIPSPNPDYPQTINSVGDDGSLVVKSCGKNLLNPTLGTSTNNGVTCTANGDGTYTLNGTATENATFYLQENIPLPIGKFRFLGCPKGGEISTKYSLQFYRYLPGTSVHDIGEGKTYNNTSTMIFSRVIINIFKGYTCNNLVFKPMITTDINATYDDFEPYKGSTTTIPLSEPLRAIGDVKDEITYQSGKWGVLRRIWKHKVEISDVVGFESYNETGNVALIKLTDICTDLSRIGLYCNIATCIFYVDRIQEQYLSSVRCYKYMVANEIKIAIRDTKTNDFISTLDAFKEYVKSNDVYVVYELDTPVFEPFVDQTLPYLSTYDGVTNISNDDALSAEMTVKYPITDASGVGSRNESRVAEIENSIGDTDISTIGDGTVTGAISEVNNSFINLAKGGRDYWNVDDANNIVDTGIGLIAGGVANAPDDGWGTLLSFVFNENYRFQFIHTWNYNKIYVRACRQENWSDWSQIS